MTGIIRNQLYIGKIVWNKRSYLKDPENEGIVTHLNDKSKHVTSDAPHLRIFDQKLWEDVQEAIGPLRVNRSDTRSNGYLISGTVRCGACGGSYSSADGAPKSPRFGCSSFKERRACSNNRLISVAVLDEAVLSALKEELLDSEFVGIATKEIAKALKRHNSGSGRFRPKLARRLKEIETGRSGLFRLLETGVPPDTIHDRLSDLREEEERISLQMDDIPKTEELAPLEAAEAYRECVANLTRSARLYSGQQNRSLYESPGLIDHVIVYSKSDARGRDVELVGDLALLFGEPILVWDRWLRE